MTPLSKSIQDICNICTVANLDNPFDSILRIVETGLSECDNAVKTTLGIEQKIHDAWSRDPLYTDMVNEIRYTQRRIQCSMDAFKYLRIVLLDALSEQKISSNSSE